MTLQERLVNANTKATKLYLDRQELQRQLNSIQQNIQQIEFAMIKSDGEIEVLNSLLQEQSNG